MACEFDLAESENSVYISFSWDKISLWFWNTNPITTIRLTAIAIWKIQEKCFYIIPILYIFDYM